MDCVRIGGFPGGFGAPRLFFEREVKCLANIKSAKKRIRVIAKKTLKNKMIKSRTKTAIKKVVAAAAAGNAEEAGTALIYAVATIDKAASKGVYHKRNASRKKSRLTKYVQKLSV
jgi:small subunit ribosomal protein S20